MKYAYRIDKIKTEERKGSGDPRSYSTVFAQCHIRDPDTLDYRLVSFFARKDDPEKDWGVEIYSGPNYVAPFTEKGKSYSRNYRKGKDLPRKYWPVANELRVAIVAKFFLSHHPGVYDPCGIVSVHWPCTDRKISGADNHEGPWGRNK